jgi:pre-mycofactocin synthase
LDLQAMLRHAPQVTVKPVYLARWIRSRSLLDLGVPNSSAGDGQVLSFFGAYGQWMGSAPPAWADLAWLREQWHGPFMIKGITRPDDARRAVDIGATAISVSNHGGNNLDSTPAAIRCLPAVADAVGDQLEVLLDGGIRRGSDVVKALALGARGNDRPPLPVGPGRKSGNAASATCWRSCARASARRCTDWAGHRFTT